jgi:hypothetical protein
MSNEEITQEILEQPETEQISETPEPIHEEKPKNRLSIIEKLRQFQELAESLDEPDQGEIEALLANIKKHGHYVFEWIELLEKNASQLREKAKMFADSAKVQENKAKAAKAYLMTALKAGGFERFPMGDFTLQLIKSLDYLPKTTASEKDFLANYEYVEPTFKWKAEPTVSDWVDQQDKIDRIFQWKMDAIKSQIKRHHKTLDLKKSTPEQKIEAQTELDKLLDLVRTEEKFMLKTVVSKVEK